MDDDLLRAELERIDMHERGGTLRGWDQVTVDVHGSTAPACSRAIGAASAIVVELPDVVVAVSASNDIDAHDITLVDVRDRLHDYPWPSTGQQTS